MKTVTGKRLMLAGSLVALGLLLLNCGGGGSSSSGDTSATVQVVACPATGTTNVAIADYSFSPASISVTANTIVKWTNNGSMTHTVTSTSVPANGTFDNQVSAGASVCLKFTSAGSYSYHCSIHPSMTGSVTVASLTVSSGGSGGTTGSTGGTTGGTGGSTGGGTGGGYTY